MNSSQYLIILFLVISLAFAAGCTQGSGTSVPATPAPTPLESLVLSPSEVPQNFTLVESRAKNSTDVGQLAMALGWQDGYVVRFTRPADGEHGPTVILQTITRYPPKNIPGISELIEKQERADINMTFSNLSSPALGSYSRAFSGTAITRIIQQPDPVNPQENVLVLGTIQQDFIEIIFSKGDLLEILRLTGPEPDLSTLTSLAQKAYNKIP
jgi:hypothetical protein